MKDIYKSITEIIKYGINTGLCHKDDKVYLFNKILDILHIDAIEEEDMEEISMFFNKTVFLSEEEKNKAVSEALEKGPSEYLKVILDYAVENNIISDSIVEKDLFDTRIMDAIMPRPSDVKRKFSLLYDSSPREATDYYYKLSKYSNYIRTDRIAKDMKWVSDTPYGKLDITINLSKPEKDPKAIAAAKLMKQSGYPKCLLCKENEGYAGRLNHPARQNHRIIPLALNHEKWYLQYSPYVYYNEHCIVFNENHIPMVINESTLTKLLEFVEIFPHYFIGSNADLPIVGGSILTHEHFQGGAYEFPMARAEIEKEIVFKGFENVSAGIVKWPMSVIRLTGGREEIIKLASKILKAWRSYSDSQCGIYAETDGELHNTITPIARRCNEKFQMDLVLRNNITTKEHPLGLFHPHEKLHHIKKENIGLIEVMGLAVLPARLKNELEMVADCIINGRDMSEAEETRIHKEWAEEIVINHNIKEKLSQVQDKKEYVMNILKDEVGTAFGMVLADAGVYKMDKEGREGFMRFINSLS